MLDAGDKTYYSLDSLINKEHYNIPLMMKQHRVVKGDSLIIGNANGIPGYSIHYCLSTDSGFIKDFGAQIPFKYCGEHEYTIRKKDYTIKRIYAPGLNWVFFIEEHLGIVLIRFGKGDIRKYCASEHLYLDHNRLSRNLIDSLIAQPDWISEVVDPHLLNPISIENRDSFIHYLKSIGAKW